MTEGPNKHVKDYLHYYVSKQQPTNYAVLVEGPWGIGKTFLVRKTLNNLPPVKLEDGVYPWRKFQEDEATRDAGRWVYVSLYGVKSAAELDNAVLRALYPLLRNSRIQLFGSLALGLLRALRYNPAIQLSEILTKFRRGTYVFDDFERCEMSVKSVFGYINQFVEHSDCKVIIIASEKDLDEADRSEFNRQKEKIVGRTLVAQSELEDAVSEFLAQVEGNEARKLLQRWSNIIALVFRQSGIGTLRVLQQAIWDFERILPALSNEDRANKEAFDVFLRSFFALSFELRARRLSADDLIGRNQKVVAEMLHEHQGGPAGNLLQAHRRYPDLNLAYSSILSDEILVDVLEKGIVEIDAIRASIAASGHFATTAEPAWRTVWHFTERSDEEFASALREMERQFDHYEFRIPGEMLHVFALRMWLADEGAIERTREQARLEAIAYIDELFGRGELKPLLPDVSDEDSVWYDSYGGLGMVQAEKEDFKAIYEHLQERRRAAGEKALPSLAEELLAELQSNPRLFVRRLVWNDAGDTRYANVPILAEIAPDRFVEIVLRQPVTHQRTILSAFKARYESNELNGKLAREKSWLTAVRDELMRRVKDAPLASRLRIERLIAWYIKPALG